MSLVQYPDSDAEDDGDSASPRLSKDGKRSFKTRKLDDAGTVNGPRLPPLPAAFHSLYAANARTSTNDDPSLHGGRKRQVPHVQGNWPSHVYLEWVPSPKESGALLDLIEEVRRIVIEHTADGHQNDLKINPSFVSDLGAPLPLHVSLSRTLQIKTDDRESFIETLTSSLKKAAVDEFSVQIAGLRWVPNFDKTRWFLILRIEKPPQDELNRLLNACNEAAAVCGHAALYIGGRGDGPMESDADEEDLVEGRDWQSRNQSLVEGSAVPMDRSDHFHVSIAWSLQEPTSPSIAAAQSTNVDSVTSNLDLSFRQVRIRIGNNVTSIALRGRKPIDQSD